MFTTSCAEEPALWPTRLPCGWKTNRSRAVFGSAGFPISTCKVVAPAGTAILNSCVSSGWLAPGACAVGLARNALPRLVPVADPVKEPNRFLKVNLFVYVDPMVAGSIVQLV